MMNYTIISGILAGVAALTIAVTGTASATAKSYAGSDLMKKYAVASREIAVDADESKNGDVGEGKNTDENVGEGKNTDENVGEGKNTDENENVGESRYADALSDFSSKLWAATANSDNNVLSPLSAYIALAMAANGASGSTLDAYSLLGYDGENTAQVNAQIYRYIKSLTDTRGDTKIAVANSIWVDDGFEVNVDYLQLLADYFAAAAFEDNLPAAVGKVNSWIEDKTNGLIKDMLDEIDESCLLMLINTLYMDAKWRTPFTKEATAKQTFTAPDGTKTDIDFMHATSNQRAILTDDYSGVVLPYNDGKLAFVALMANDDTLSTADVIASLSGENAIEALAADAEYARVRLAIPKFKLETSKSLVEPLAKIGMGGIFASDADYSAMGSMKSGNTGFTVGEVLQNTYIRVDEDGTEAAAATVIMMKATAARPTSELIELTFDRPYVWAVIDETTGAVLFCGSYDYPV